MGNQQQGADRLADYVPVNTRIEKFYEKYPEGSIQTEIVKWENEVIVVKAYAYRNPEDPRPGVGHAYEKEGSNYINKTSALENCETSAVGRALANLGFEIKKSVASREEVENAQHQQNQAEAKPKQSGKGASKPNVVAVATKAQVSSITSAIRSLKLTRQEFIGIVNEQFNTEHETVDAALQSLTEKDADKLITVLADYKKEATASA